MLLNQAIKQVESSNNQYAMRFEYGLFAQSCGWQFTETHEIMEANKCNDPTARMIACTSWGLYQLLGVNVYNCGISTSIGEYLNNAKHQEITALVFFQSLKLPIQFDQDMSGITDAELLQFAAKWNGPGNPEAYAAAIRYAGQ